MLRLQERSGLQGAPYTPRHPCLSVARIEMAEGVGFEPTEDVPAFDSFQDCCLKPLGHPSAVVER